MHHKEELFKLCVVLLISRCKRFCEVTASFFMPSLLVTSLLYQLLDLALNCLETTQNHYMIG